MGGNLFTHAMSEAEVQAHAVRLKLKAENGKVKAENGKVKAENGKV
jgi:hypothetical protein